MQNRESTETCSKCIVRKKNHDTFWKMITHDHGRKTFRPFKENQLVHQSGVWSIMAYNMFLNLALDLFEKYSLWLNTGSLKYADNELLLSSQNTALFTMLEVRENYTSKERYILGEQKIINIFINKIKIASDCVAFKFNQSLCRDWKLYWSVLLY